MNTQQKLKTVCDQIRTSPPLAILATLFILAGSAKGDPGDKWILPIHHTDGSGWVERAGAGYASSTAKEGSGIDGVRRIYWALEGLSLTNNNEFPTTTQLYSIQWYRPATGATDWQPIESMFGGSAGETWPIDSRIPWAGSLSQNHQWIAAQGSDGAPGTWVKTGPGPHTPTGTNYNAGDSGNYMWLTRNSWLYAKWDYSFSIDHTWSALRLTQITGTSSKPVIQSVTQSSNVISLVWSAVSGKVYQVQYKTNLTETNWIDLGDTISGTSATASASDLNPPDAYRLYRVKMLP
ncbi:MAG: hypothetical protein NT154_22550 [Verrucomicrobia bacterium]|nr:hypothetical protein [Verrucomicrobiota bacterium]